MALRLIRKLERFTRLSEADKAALHRLAARPLSIAARQDLIGEGDNPRHVNLILDGWACRYKQLENGRRQIIAILLPGDLCDDHIDLLPQMDHSIGTLTSVTFARLSRPALEAVMADHSRIQRALWWEMMVTAAIQREWTVSIGRRDALGKIAHFVCEISARLCSIGMSEGENCPFHLTQVELSDALGLTPVHVNRSIRDLRTRELIVLKDQRLTVLDRPALQRLAEFSANYLHLDHEGARFDAGKTEAD